MKQLTLIIGCLVFLHGCAESEYEQCKHEASKLWDNQQGAKNEAYWQAVERCKQKYGSE